MSDRRLGETPQWTPPKARLRLTLQRPPSKGGTETAYVVYPNTYEEAVDLVHEVYNLGDRSIKKEDITLCCLSTRHIGYDQQFMWAAIIPREWQAVVRPHIDEVGVFLAQDENEWNGVVSLGKRILGPAKSLLGLLAIGYALRRS
ncbi:hypothetical protein M413DRAFT_448841 [Hebeloma cylindrosporum]|uniref:Uncharacterized protein n=1 Tax=Hebeloma cylindrosporum TaxID=76867 RepID=A0A0C3BXZ2_HEBCY|nr:hypothetical protein M413DRAFT_448841 [Hebeloma cylindrosporum h7]